MFCLQYKHFIILSQIFFKYTWCTRLWILGIDWHRKKSRHFFLSKIKNMFNVYKDRCNRDLFDLILNSVIEGMLNVKLSLIIVISVCNIYVWPKKNIIPKPQGHPDGGASGGHCPPEIFASLTKLEVILHKADLGYSVTIRQSLYLTSI
jgi:hypothetical protein